MVRTMLADRVARRRAESVTRADPVTLEEFGYLLGQQSGSVTKTKSGVSMGVNRALGIAAWYSGVRYISETIAGLPVHTYRDSGGVRTQRADPPWLTRPDVELTWFSLVEMLLMSLLHRPAAYAYKIRNDLGQVVGLRGIHPDRVKMGVADTGRKIFCIDGDTSVPFTTREILHIPGLSADGVQGLDPLRLHAEALGIIAAADEYAGRFFDDSSIRAYLTTDAALTETQANEMQQTWEAHHQGLAMSHRIAVFGGGLEYKTIGLNAEQTQLLASRKYGVAEVSRMLRLPPHKLYDLERATFSNIEQQSIEAVIDGIRPWVVRLESAINADRDLLPEANFIEWTIEGLLRGDLKSRYEAYGAGISGGFLMPAEPRSKENLPYVDGSEILLRPLNMQTYGPDAAVGAAGEARTLSQAEILQKVYLAVTADPPLLSADEARVIAGLTGPAPTRELPDV